MIQALKELLVVISLAMVTFWLARPLALRFIEAADFDRRRNVWLALTITAFVSPSFWIFVVVAVPLVLWASARDRSPLALYVVLLHVIPPLEFYVPFPGLGQLFDLSNYRLLALLVLLPLALRGRIALATPDQGGATSNDRPRRLAGVLLLAYGALVILNESPHVSATHSVRQGFLFVLDTWLIFYCVSVFCNSRRSINETMASFVLICAVYAPIAAFETIRSWLLYEGIGWRWGNPLEFAWLLRGDRLRAQASAGHALPFGYMMAIAIGFWLYLRRVGEVRAVPGWVVFGWLSMGLLASISRGPWLVALATVMMFTLLAQPRMTTLIRTVTVATLAGGALLMTPMGDRVIEMLPFVGSVDSYNVLYRQRLAAASWALIQLNPLFGDPFALRYLEELRQGQGIIDLVNTYASVALFNGLVGLALFLGAMVVGLWAATGVMQRSRRSDHGLAALGACLIACMVGTLLMMATGSFGTGLAKVTWVLAGLLLAYARIGRLQLAAAR
jgi:hypothetical protein